MEVITKFRHESVNGISLDVLKSGLQKFCRRKEEDYGLKVLTLIEEFGEGRIMSNILNRMVVIMSEEISINNPNLPIKILELYQKVKKGDTLSIYKMYMVLLESKKCRLISDLKTLYNLPPYYNVKNLDEEHKKLLENYEDKKYIKEMYSYSFDEEETLLRIREKLTKKSYDVFMLISYYFRKCFKVVKLWKVILEKSNENNKCLKKFWTLMTHKERPISIILY